MKLTISGSSTALFSTWYFIDEYAVLFDAGDGVVSSLTQKLGKIKHAFISHADRDHLSALYRLNPLNKNVNIYYPKDAGSFKVLEDFSKNFDPDKPRSNWKPIVSEDTIYLRNDLKLTAVRNEHIQAEKGVFKSLSYKIESSKQKLKPEFAALPPEQIKALIQLKGREHLMYELCSPIISYSGDTPVDDYSRFDNSNILIHEATFIDRITNLEESNVRNKHSSLEEVVEMAANIKLETLVLGHFSLRYSQEQIDSEIISLCSKFGIKIPVYRLLPGVVYKDILSNEPIFG